LPSRPDRRQTAVWLVEGGDEPGKEIGEGLAVVIGPAAHGRRELAAAAEDPAIWPAARPYLGMQALPSVLDAVQDKVRVVLRTGWRPPYASGPARDELAGLLREPTARAAA
jgi:hypothetical protein